MTARRIRILAVTLANFALIFFPADAFAQPQTNGLKAKKPRLDANGDPLPDGAVARIGTHRWATMDNPLVYSPDGKYVLAAGQQTRLFDASKGTVTRVFPVTSNRAHFTTDGKTAILSSPLNRKLIFVNLESGATIRELQLSGHVRAWSANGKFVACLNDNPGVYSRDYTVWDIEAGKQLQQWFLAATSVALSPDGKFFAVSNFSEITMLDVASGQTNFTVPSIYASNGDLGANRILAFSPDGKTLAAAESQKVTRRNAVTGEILKTVAKNSPFDTQRSQPATLAYSPDGRYLAAGCNGGTLYVWDTKTDAQVCKIAGAGGSMPIFGLTFAPDGKTLITQALFSHSARLWEIPSGKEMNRGGAGVRADILAFHPDGKKIVTAAPGDAPEMWDAATGKPVLQFEAAPPPAGTYAALAFDPRCKWFGAQAGNQLTLWNAEQGKLLHKSAGWTSGYATEKVFVTAALDERTLIAVFQGDMNQLKGNFEVDETSTRWTMIGQWDVQTGQVKDRFKVKADKVDSLQMSADRKTLVGLGEFSDVSSQRYVFGWDPRAKAQLFRFPLPSKNCDRVWLSPDGKTVVVYSSTAVGSELKYRFYFLETASGKVRHVAESKAGDPHASLFEFGHERLAAVAMSSCIMLIDPLSGEELRRLDSDQRSIRALAFSADHKLLASADGEVTTLIWDSSGALPRPVTIRLTDKELALHWADLLSDDAGAAYCAICRMSLAPEQTVAFIKDRVQPAKNLLTAEKLKALADYLDSDRYTEREKASAELMRLGELARDTLEEVRKSPPSLEAKHRAEIILKKLQEARENGPEGLKGEPLREARIVEILERIGSAEARAILKRYAVGAPGTVLSREATASIQRMTK